MNSFTRRRFLAVLATLPTAGIALAACGGDSDDTGGEPQDPGGGPDTTTGAGGTIDAPGTTDGSGTVPIGLDPARADEVLVRIDQSVGGFTTAEFAFAQLPSLLVTGDGTAYRPGAQVAIYPGPLLPTIERGRLDQAAAGALVQAAADAGLLGAPPDYTVGEPTVTDVGSTVVTIDTGSGETLVHSAYALGFEDETSPARVALQAFVDRALAVPIGATEIHLPDEYAIWARPAAVADYAGSDPQPSVVPWPIASIDLTSADTCLVVDARDVQVAFEAANQLTLFEQAGATYSIAVRPLLPGSPACA